MVIVERLSFDNDAPPYHAYHSAQHTVRYLLVRDHVKGKRVLDVGCGQGFGSQMIAKWGAAHVTGVDIAPYAIEVARSLFSDENVQYLVGDATELGDVLYDERPFDLIVCFETIEHVSDTARLLEQITKLRATNSTVVISCPNDHAADEHNPYHRRRFTFEEFRELTNEALGPADQWLLGAPVLGQMNYVMGDELAEKPGTEPINIVRLRQLPSTFMASAQDNTKPNSTNCTYYVGVWGSQLQPDAVIAPESHTAFLDPWRTIDYLQSAAIDRNRRVEELRRRLLYHTEERAQLQEQARAMEQELATVNSQARAMEQELATVNSQARAMEQELATVNSQARAMKHELATVNSQARQEHGKIAGLLIENEHFRELVSQYERDSRRTKWLLDRLRDKVRHFPRDLSRRIRASRNKTRQLASGIPVASGARATAEADSTAGRRKQESEADE
jgi:SAM-dependent methyltransferase